MKLLTIFFTLFLAQLSFANAKQSAFTCQLISQDNTTDGRILKINVSQSDSVDSTENISVVYQNDSLKYVADQRPFKGPIVSGEPSENINWPEDGGRWAAFLGGGGVFMNGGVLNTERWVLLSLDLIDGISKSGYLIDDFDLESRKIWRCIIAAK